MKYLAILKDSFREAIDTKVVYFTIGLSLLVIAFFGSITFRQVPAEEEMRRGTELVSKLVGFATQGRGPTYEVADFEQTNEASEPWLGNYRFTYVIDAGDPKRLEEFRRQGLVFTAQQVEQNFAQLPWIDKLSVREEKTDKPAEVRFLVETTGSKVSDRRGWTYEPALFFGALPVSFLHLPLSKLIEFVADDVIGTFGAAFIMLLSAIITAFFIPNMLRKGTIDLLLAKPIHRTTLLIYKFIGGLTFMFLNAAVIMVGIWLVLGLQTGLWLPSLLLCIFVFTFQFAIFYAVSALLGVLTRSPIVSILTTFVAWGAIAGIGIGFRWFDDFRTKLADAKTLNLQKIATGPKTEDMAAAADFQIPRWLSFTADAIHWVTPGYKDLDRLTTHLIRGDLMDKASAQWKKEEKSLGSIHWAHSIGVTVTFIALMLGLSCWRFATKDY